MATTPSWRDLSFKDLRTEPTSATDGYGWFNGYLAVFDNTDAYKDVIRAGAFTKTLQEAKARRDGRAAPDEGRPAVLLPLLWQHSQVTPIGGLTEAKEDAHGLFVRGFVDLDTVQGREAHSGLRKGYSTGMSIGYRAIKDAWKGGVRNLLELQLLEGSLVTMPANVEAYVTAVKSACGKSDWPLADQGQGWDAEAAAQRLHAFAQDHDLPSLLSGTHFYSEEAASPDQADSYKLPFCDVIGGEVKAIPRAIRAAAGQLAADIPDAAQARVQRRIAAYHQRMAETFDDEDITPNWAAPVEPPVEPTREPSVEPTGDAPTILPDPSEAKGGEPDDAPDAHASTPEPVGMPDTDWLLKAAIASLDRTMRRDWLEIKAETQHITVPPTAKE